MFSSWTIKIWSGSFKWPEFVPTLRSFFSCFFFLGFCWIFFYVWNVWNTVVSIKSYTKEMEQCWRGDQLKMVKCYNNRSFLLSLVTQQLNSAAGPMQPNQVPPNQNFINRAPGPIPVSHGNVQQQVNKWTRFVLARLPVFPHQIPPALPDVDTWTAWDFCMRCC